MSLKYNPIPSESLEVVGEEKNYNPNNEVYRNFHILNLDNFNDLNDLDTIFLYKYFSIQNLKYIHNNNKLYIDKIVESWEDCYENFFLKCNFFTCDNIPLTAKNQIPGIFGQSWTTKNESDAMWRIYSNNKRGVKIKTTAKKLFNALYIDDECMANTWFGKVQYDTMDNFKNILKRKIQQQDFQGVFQYTLPATEFMKRKEFAHEEEFRVIVMLDSERTNQFKQYKRLAYNIDVNNFVDEYCLDPRLSDTELEVLKQELVAMGANRDKIIKSNLYSFQPFKFHLRK